MCEYRARPIQQTPAATSCLQTINPCWGRGVSQLHRLPASRIALVTPIARPQTNHLRQFLNVRRSVTRPTPTRLLLGYCTLPEPSDVTHQAASNHRPCLSLHPLTLSIQALLGSPKKGFRSVTVNGTTALKLKPNYGNWTAFRQAMVVP